MIETKFKYTEVGLIPQDWEVKPLMSIGEMFKGTGIQKSDFVEKGVPCIHYGQIHTSYNSYTFKTLSFVNQDKMKGNNIAHTGDVIIATTSEDVEACCKPVAWLGKEDIAISGDAHIFRHSEDPVFLSFLMQTDLFATQKRKVATGTKVTRVHGNDILKFVLPFPKQKEQRMIATALMDIDSLIADLQALIDKKRNIKQGVMNELLSGKKRLQGFTGEWEHMLVIEITGKIYRGQTLKSDNFCKGNIPVVAGGRQYAGYHNIANQEGRTITLSGSGASAGYVMLHNVPIFATDCSVIKESKSFSLDFLYYYFVHIQDELFGLQTGGAQPHVYPRDIEAIPIQIPPTKAEQTAIANILSDMDDEIKQLDAKLSKYQALKQGMMQQLLTGKIRLV